ncbi:SAV_2336 N-terminal domain-related protein, partial [Nocardia takedensis]|uniref:SAV_2336 N-terminal domain-related protein n=1 Tax=Nocardia takedensis TaxID=259390 RepID=UPI0012F6BF03
MIERLLRDIVASGADIGTSELAEIIWLANRIAAPPDSGFIVDSPRTVHDPEVSEAEGAQQREDSTNVKSPVYSVGQERGRTSTAFRSGVRVRMRRADSLDDPLAVMRAFRPLGRRPTISGRVVELDEEATVDASIDQRMLVPVVKPASDRWLSLALVIDTHHSMLLWHDLIQELQRAITGTGVFRTVQTWHLHLPDDTTPVQVSRSRDGMLRNPSEIINPAGSQLILVLSDTLADVWMHPRLHSVLLKWGTHNAVAIINVLPERMWTRGALSPAIRLARASKPATANIAWSLTNPPGHRRYRGHPMMGIPIVDTTPAVLSDLAYLIAGDGTTHRMTCILISTEAAKAQTNTEAETANDLPSPRRTAIDALRDFNGKSSPTVQQLAAYLSVVPLTLPVMNLVRSVMVPGADHGHLAEIALSALVEPWDGKRTVHPEQLELVFRAGVRDALLGSLDEDDIVQIKNLVQTKLSAYLAGRPGRAGEFAAVQLVDDGHGDHLIADESLSFAELKQAPWAAMGRGTGGPEENRIPASARPLREMVRIYGSEDLPAISEVDPYLLGTTRSIFGRAGQYGNHDEYVPRTANDVDLRLAEALSRNQLVVVVGPALVGKTRTLFEAVRAQGRSMRVLWPVPEALSEVVTHPRIASSTDPLIVWLDDIHLYLTDTAGLTPAMLAALTARQGPTVVVATLRSTMRAQLRGEGELRRDARTLLEQAVTIGLASTADDPAERAAANRVYPGYAADPYGLGENLVRAPELVTRYDAARASDPLLWTVIAVAIDWTRIGRLDPIAEPDLIDFTVVALRETHPSLEVSSGDVRAAIHTARTPPPGSGGAAALLRTTLLDDRDTRGYRAFDYLVAADEGNNHHRPRAIPESFWHTVARGSDPDKLLALGLAAEQRGNGATALDLFLEAARAGNSRAMDHVGRLLLAAGEADKAETWFRRAAYAGDLSGLKHLGQLLVERGAVTSLEDLYREFHLRTFGRDSPLTIVAGSLLAEAYQSTGRLEEAISLLEQTLNHAEQVSGQAHPDTLSASHNLALAYQQAGRLGEAIDLLERVAGERTRVSGHDHPATLSALHSLALAYQSAGRVGEAIDLFERVAGERTRVSGHDDLGTLSVLHSLAVAYRSAGRVGEAIDLFERLAGELSRVSGHDDLGT